MRLIIIALFVMLLATSAQAGTFRDDFEDGNLDGWMLTFGNPPIEPLESIAKVQNGVLTVRRASAWAIHLTVGDADTWSNYTIECDMRITERILNEQGGSFHYSGLAGRSRPDENRLTKDVVWFLLNLKANPTIWKGVIIEPNDWLINVQIPFNAKLNTWHHLRSVMKGENFQFYIDDVLVDSFKSNNIPTGRVGICIGGCTAEFDNIVITGDDIPEVGPSGYEVSPKCKLVTVWSSIKQIQ